MAYKPAPWNWKPGLLSKVAGRDVTKPAPLRPFKPQLLPGMYDPQLDWQGQSEQQGYGFSQGDYATGNARRNEALTGYTGSYGNENFSTLGALGLIDRNRARGQENYTTDTQNLQRNYTNLGASQGERARSAGVAGGGSLAQALAKRTENQGRDQGALDTNWRRFQEDLSQQRGQALYGATTGQQDADIGMGRTDAAHTLFGQQLGEAKIQSAGQMGTLPSTPGPGEFLDPDSPIGKALGVPKTAGQVPGFGPQGIPSGTHVVTGAQGTYFTQPAVGGGFWHIYPDGRRVKVK